MIVPNFLTGGDKVKVPKKLIYNDQEFLGIGKKLRKNKKMPAFSIYSDLQEGSTQSKTKRNMSSSQRQHIHNKIVNWPNSTTVSTVLSPINNFPHQRNQPFLKTAGVGDHPYTNL